MNYRDKAQRVYNSFSPFIRDYIYQSEWDSIREVQIEAANVIFSTQDNLLICSSTASGKTEAAFFPVLSLVASPTSSVEVLYIAPLKALINDQFERLNVLMKESGISVFHWHGDVGSSQKAKFLQNPTGVLQITPESLESMLINRKNDIPRLFADLKFIIIDEIHTLMGFDRGSQVCCLIERISRLINHSPRRIGLSATIGDTAAAAEWLSRNTDRKCSVVDIKSSGTKWRLALQHFYAENGQNQTQETSLTDEGYEFIYNSVKNKKSLIFSNSREETELVTATMRQIAEYKGDDDIFHIHHGNLSAALRESAESIMKDDSRQAVTCATVTLELGVDIGRLERIVNIGAPNTVSSFLQRIGRSGRRENTPEMVMVFREENPLPNTPLYEIIPWNFLQGIAIIQLYIEERWLEPPFKKSLPLSLLYHQTMSVLACSGEMSAAKLAKNVLSLAPFEKIEKEDYRDLLIHLIKTGHIQQTEENRLIIGLKGEKIINNFKFYAVFKDSEDFTVRHQSEEIGTITTPPPVGERFALAGRVWEVEEADIQKRLIYVKPVKGKMEASWPGDKGEIHTKILKRMKKVLEEDTIYPYLKPDAVKRLAQARQVARNTGMLRNRLICLGGINYCLFPWLGTKSMRTLKRFIQYKCAPALGISSIEYNSCYYITFKMEGASSRSFIEYLNNVIDSEDIKADELVDENEMPVFEKFDLYIPRALLQKAYCTDKLSSAEIVELARELKNEIV